MPAIVSLAGIARSYKITIDRFGCTLRALPDNAHLLLNSMEL